MFGPAQPQAVPWDQEMKLPWRARAWALLAVVPFSSSGRVGQGETTQVETKFLRLHKPVGLGDHIDGWCWLGGWDKARIFYAVMVEGVKAVYRRNG